MKSLVKTLAIALALLTGQAKAAGFQSAVVADPDDAPLEIGIWYPSDAPVPAQPDDRLRQALAVDAAIAGRHLPLVVISHGNGGWLAGHADTALALAEAGFVAVAVSHTGDNSKDESYRPSRWMVDRPRHISRVLDHMLGDWSGSGRIDASRTGMFGFSAGGYTALVAIGGVPDLQAAVAHCAADPDELVCRLGMTDDFDAPDVATRPASIWVHDPRIRAAVVVAPGLGFAFDRHGLADVKIPIQLWAGENDRNVPYASNTEIVRQALPRQPEFHLVEGAGHFAFLRPCNPKLETALPEVWAMVCVDQPGFDRAAFHRRFNAEVVRFFRSMAGAD